MYRKFKQKSQINNHKSQIRTNTEFGILFTEYQNTMLTNVYRILFWIAYLAVLITTFIPVAGELNKTHIGPESFKIRLDHLLHLLVYFLICMYYLFGIRNRIDLFEKNSFLKFILLILLLGIITEVVQIWVPERAFNVFDLISNVAGVGLGVFVIKMAQRHSKRSEDYA
ncbi:MAG: VanZ family protein [Bacteroidales bacterium]|nr:VanZ family protein [Bacteroidales bacterium]